MDSPQQRLAEILAALDRKKATHKLEHYAPYEFQKKFHHAEGHLTPGVLAHLKALVCANQIGKCNSISVQIATPSGDKKIGDLWGKETKVLSWPDKESKRVLAWVRKPPEECFRIEMS